MSTRTHEGGCHCSNVRFAATFDLDTPVGRCNCTLCTKRGATGAMMKPDAFRLLTGEGELTRYSGKHGMNHFFFCRRCGMQLFGKGDIPELGGAYVSVNVNCLDDVDPAGLANVVHWDGRHDNWQAGSRATPWPVAT